MSGDINLLPNELRDKERKVKEEQDREQVVPEVRYSQPTKIAQEVLPGQALSWWQKFKITLSGLFKSTAKADEVVTLNMEKKIATATEVKDAVRSVASAAEALKTNWNNNHVNQKDKVIFPIAPKPIVSQAQSSVEEIKKPSLGQVQFKPEINKLETQPVVKPVSPAVPVMSPKVTPVPTAPRSAVASALEQLDVNLIPLGQRSQQTGPAKRFVGAVWLIGLLLVGMVYGGLVFYHQQKIGNYQRQQEDLVNLQQKLEGLRGQSEEILAVSVKLQTVARLLAEKITWQPVFNFLERNTVPTVYYTSLAADSGSKITLMGQGSNYTEVMRQMRAFEQASEVALVEISNLQKVKSTGGGLISFSFVLTLKPTIFQNSVSIAP